MIVKIIMIPVYIIGFSAYYGLAIFTGLSVLLGLLIPSFILHDKEELDLTKKIINDPIKIFQKSIKLIGIIAIILAIFNTIVTILT